MTRLMFLRSSLVVLFSASAAWGQSYPTTGQGPKYAPPAGPRIAGPQPVDRKFETGMRLDARVRATVAIEVEVEPPFEADGFGMNGVNARPRIDDDA